jgi:diacylglycerol kinase
MKFALNGLFYALRTERNVQIWLGILILTFIAGFILKISRIEFLIIGIWMFGIGTAEYLNTAIEKLADRVTTEHDEQIKHVKDISAGATLICSIGAFLTCLSIFIPKILERFVH